MVSRNNASALHKLATFFDAQAASHALDKVADVSFCNVTLVLFEVSAALDPTPTFQVVSYN